TLSLHDALPILKFCFGFMLLFIYISKLLTLNTNLTYGEFYSLSALHEGKQNKTMAWFTSGVHDPVHSNSFCTIVPSSRYMYDGRSFYYLRTNEQFHQL